MFSIKWKNKEKDSNTSFDVGLEGSLELDRVPIKSYEEYVRDKQEEVLVEKIKDRLLEIAPNNWLALGNVVAYAGHNSAVTEIAKYLAKSVV